MQAETAVGVSDMISQVQVLVATYLGLADQLDSAAGDTSHHLSISLPGVRAAVLSSLRPMEPGFAGWSRSCRGGGNR